MPLDEDLVINFEGKDFVSGKKGESKSFGYKRMAKCHLSLMWKVSILY